MHRHSKRCGGEDAMKPKLTVTELVQAAKAFAAGETHHRERSLFGVTDGKAVGTYRNAACLSTRFRPVNSPKLCSRRDPLWVI